MRSTASEITAREGDSGPLAETWLLLGSTYAVMLAGALLLATAEQAVGYLMMVLVACAGHALVAGPGGRAYLSKPATKFLAVGALLFGLAESRYANVHVSHGLAHFLLLVQVIELYGRRRTRSVRLIQVAAIFQALVAGIWALSAVYLPAFVLLTVSLLVNSAALAVLPPAGERRPLVVRPPDRAGPWRALLPGLWLPAAVILALTGLTFVLMPRPHVGGPGYNPVLGQVTGFTQNVSLREVGQLRTSSDVALEVQFFAEDSVGTPLTVPPRMLLRGVSLPIYRSGQWFGYGAALRQAPRDGRRAEGRTVADFLSSRVYLFKDADVARRHIRQRITVKSKPMGNRFALYRPVSLEGIPPYVAPVSYPSHNLRSTDPITPGESYEVVSLVPIFKEQQLREAGTPRWAASWGIFWDIPSSIRPVLERTAREIEQLYPVSNDYERVVAAQSYLLNPRRFTYTFNLPELGQKEPIEAFLTETRTGSCEQFSTAMALILRTWGIPTRLVVGYKGGEYDRSSGTHLFRDKHAHAWLEVCFNDLGWVEFDPTPGASVAEEQPSGLLPALRRLGEKVRYALVQTRYAAEIRWSSYVIGFSRGQQRHMWRGIADAGRELAGRAASVFRPLWPGMPDMGLLQVVLLVVLVTFVGMAMYLGAHWLQGWLAQDATMGPDAATVRFYQDLLRILRRKGLPRPAHVTAREFARLAAPQLAAANEDAAGVAEALDLVTETYYLVRFGGYPLTDAQRSQVKAALRVLARARRLKAGLNAQPRVEPAS